MCNNRADSGRDWGKKILHRQSPSSDQGVNVWWKKIWDDANDAKLKVLVDNLKAPDLCLILHAKHAGY